MAVNVVSRWRRSLWIDAATGAAVTVIVARSVELGGEGSTLFQVAGGAAIGLVAFVVTPVATLLTLSGGVRTKALERRHRRTLIRAMAWAFALAGALLAASIVGGAVVTSPAHGFGIRQVIIGIVVAAGLATARLFWFFVAFLGVRDADDAHPISLVRD